MEAIIQQAKGTHDHSAFEGFKKVAAGGVTIIGTALYSGMVELDEHIDVSPHSMLTIGGISDSGSTWGWGAKNESTANETFRVQTHKFQPSFSSHHSDQWRNDLLAELVGIAKLEDDWDGLGSAIPEKSAIADAKVVAQIWSASLPKPIVDVTEDGTLVFDLFDGKGMSIGSLEFLGNEVVSFALVKGNAVVVPSTRTTISRSDLSLVFKAVLRTAGE